MNCGMSAFGIGGHLEAADECPLLGVKRTWACALQMSANDPKRTSADRFWCASLTRYDALS